MRLTMALLAGLTVFVLFIITGVIPPAHQNTAPLLPATKPAPAKETEDDRAFKHLIKQMDDHIAWMKKCNAALDKSNTAMNEQIVEYDAWRRKHPNAPMTPHTWNLLRPVPVEVPD